MVRTGGNELIPSQPGIMKRSRLSAQWLYCCSLTSTQSLHVCPSLDHNYSDKYTSLFLRLGAWTFKDSSNCIVFYTSSHSHVMVEN